MFSPFIKKCQIWAPLTKLSGSAHHTYDKSCLPKVPEIDEYHVDEISVPVYTWGTLEIVQTVHYRAYTEERSWLHTLGT